MTRNFPLLHGIPGTLARSYSGWTALAPVLAVLGTWALIASGADDRVRDFLADRVPAGDHHLRFAELMFSILWPILPALWVVRRGFHENDREQMAAGCAVLQSIIVNFLITTTLKFATGRPSPTSFESARVFYGFARDNGELLRVMWPSGHTTEAFGAASAIAAFWPERRRLRLVAYALASLVAGEMVFSSFHWLSDVVAGILLATPIGWATGATFRRWVGAMDRFQLSGVTLVLELGDITKARVDAIVNAANEAMLGGGGVDGAIHRAAGRELVEACRKVPEVRPGVRCPTGEARITPGFALPAKHVIHTVGPIYESPDESGPVLASAYRSSLELAKKHGLATIAFPAISCGVFGYPLDEAAEIALAACREHAAPLREVRFVLFGEETYRAWLAAAKKLAG